MNAADRPEEVVLHRVGLPLTAPLRSAHGVEERREIILVEVRPSDGPSGWGECSALGRPTYTGEYLAGAWALLRDHLVPAWLVGDRLGVVGHPMATGALADARTDATLRRLGRPLVESVANRLGPSRPALERTAVIGRGSIEEILARVDAVRRRGVAAVKLKVTGDARDLDVVIAVRDAHPDLAVAVDANGSLDRRGFDRLDELGLLYIEQPAPADDPVRSARWAGSGRTPVALDESIDGPGTVDVAATIGAAAVINVKPARLGGVDAAIETVRRADEHGLGIFVGGMWESGVGRATALALAASGRCTLPTDLGPSGGHLRRDVLADAIELDDVGRVVVPTGAGFGGEIDEAALDEATIDRVVLR